MTCTGHDGTITKEENKAMTRAKVLEPENLFREEYLTRAEDIFQALDAMERQWTEPGEKYNKEYCERVRQLITEFRSVLKKHVLFDCPAGFWAYSIIIRGGGIYLYLDHYKVTSWKMMRLGCFFIKEESYELLCLKTKLLTVEEYAALHHIEHVTAVTRIRRGKIRSAVKVGTQWRIPELAEPVQRGYQSTEYTWMGRLTGLPERYQVIEDYNRAEFFQDEKELTLFHVRFSGENVEPMEFTCIREQRGRIEQLLIAHPDVTCISDVVCESDRKSQME